MPLYIGNTVYAEKFYPNAMYRERGVKAQKTQMISNSSKQGKGSR